VLIEIALLAECKRTSAAHEQLGHRVNTFVYLQSRLRLTPRAAGRADVRSAGVELADVNLQLVRAVETTLTIRARKLRKREPLRMLQLLVIRQVLRPSELKPARPAVVGCCSRMFAPVYVAQLLGPETDIAKLADVRFFSGVNPLVDYQVTQVLQRCGFFSAGPSVAKLRRGPGCAGTSTDSTDSSGRAGKERSEGPYGLAENRSRSPSPSIREKTGILTAASVVFFYEARTITRSTAANERDAASGMQPKYFAPRASNSTRFRSHRSEPSKCNTSRTRCMGVRPKLSMRGRRFRVSNCRTTARDQHLKRPLHISRAAD
jgi:hypothetical protein